MIAQLKSVVSELWGLFVDDGLLAGLALAWIVVAVVIVHGRAGSISPGVLAALFAAGLLVILAVSVLRAAQRARAKRRLHRGVG